MGKDKLRKFKENETFSCLVQPQTQEVLRVNHPLKGNWNRDFFKNDKPIILELGCGKGEYTVDLAMRNPDCNFIGVDIKGARLWKGAKFATEKGLGNVGFLRTRIEFIESLFAPGEVSGIWITFADPQIGREKKRLTSPLFLNRYRNFMKPGGIVHLKTDSRYLYEYTKAVAGQNMLDILASGTDIYGQDHDRLYDSSLASLCGRDAVDALFEVKTFYEGQYLAQGFPITYMAFRIDHEGEYISPQWDEDTWKDEAHHFLVSSGVAAKTLFYQD